MNHFVSRLFPRIFLSVSSWIRKQISHSFFSQFAKWNRNHNKYSLRKLIDSILVKTSEEFDIFHEFVNSWKSKFNFCCFHPILVTWFLVVLGDEVTKVLPNSLFIFYFVLPVLPVLPCKWKMSYRKSSNLTKLPKIKLPQYVMSRTLMYNRDRG